MDQHNCHVEIDTKVTSDALVSLDTISLKITGMGCQNCAARVHNSLLHQDGVTEVNVDLETHRAYVIFDASKVKIGGLLAAVGAAGNDGHHIYSATLAT